MKINTYTLEANKKAGKPCFIVTITHIMRAGVYFFNTMQEAKIFIENAKKELNIYAELKYNSGNYDKSYKDLINMVLSNNNICIGENGKTYQI